MNPLQLFGAESNPALTPRTGPSAASTDTFLKLLVAQLRTQNPLEPQKGTEFVTQLAQFNTLEQLVAIRAELAALRRDTAAHPHSSNTSKS
jgi:flagellar basal-body rod modification protein FlgD